MSKIKFKRIGIIVVSLITFSAFSFASGTDEYGDILNSEYFQEPEYQAVPLSLERSFEGIGDNGKSVRVRLKNKGGYLANFSVSWGYIDGTSTQQSFREFPIGQYKEIIVPYDAINVRVSAGYPGFLGGFNVQIFNQKLTKDIVKYGEPDFVEYHVWGATIAPKWRLMN